MARGQRFDQQVQLGVQSTSTGAAQGLMGLSGKLQRIRDQKFAEAESKIIEQQTRAGQEAFRNGEKPQFMDEDRLIGGVSAKAYNKGLRASYLASLSNDVREDLATIERENSADSAAYQNAVGAHRAALAKEVDPTVLPDVLAAFDDATSRGMTRVQDAEFRVQRQIQADTINSAAAAAGNEAARLARMGDVEAAVQSLMASKAHLDSGVDAGTISQGAADEAFSKLQKEALEQESRFNFESLAESEGFDAAYQELDRIAGKPPKGWAPDEWSKYIKSQQEELGRKERRLEQDAVATKAEIKKAENFAKIDSRLSDDSVVLDDLSAKVFDSYYNERILPLVENMPPEVRDATIASFVDKTKMVPASLTNQISSNIRSGNPDLIAESVSMAQRLDNIPGVADDVFSPNERAFGETVVDLMANMEPEEAVRVAHAATNPQDKARIDARHRALKDQFGGGLRKQDKNDWFNEKSAEAFSQFWGADPSIDPLNQDKMGREWGTAYEAHFIEGMSKEQAIEAANGNIKRNWSEFNGKIMKYSPGVYYAAPDGDNEYIFDQLARDVSEDSLEDVSVEQIILSSDDETARKASLGQPDYAVSVILPSGEIFRYPSTGPNAIRWKPDLQGELDKRENENAMAAAERRRANADKKTERGAFADIERMRGF